MYSGDKHSVNTSALKSYYFRCFDCCAIEESLVVTKIGLMNTAWIHWDVRSVVMTASNARMWIH